ncbi:MAG: 30S ribosomal protein S6--L-glutamate ligase [Proteobacteria bacterium]|nr:30S ribosomal protein S6--L-glutamate ligase [Pseudomonadota bacterium]
MKIILLASNPNLYSNQRIVEAAEKRGHEIEFVNVGECYIKVAPKNCEVFYDEGKRLENIDYVIPRIKPSLTFYGTAIVRQFEVMGINCLNGSEEITKSRDKLHTLQVMSQHGINLPDTSFANSSYDTKDLIKLVGSAPLVVKLLEGTKGVGVVLAETNKAAESVINAFRSLKADILVQHYIKESKGQDIRCFVVGGKVVASMERLAQEGEFRANMHLGATAKAIEVSNEERDLAIKATKIIGLEVAGVDMVRSNSGPKLLEVNSSPGLEGIENSTGVDIADKMIEFLEVAKIKKIK